MTKTDQILSRLAQYDEIIGTKKQQLIDEMMRIDCSSETPVDKNKFIMNFVDFCICKVYGVKSPAYRKSNSTFLKDKNTKYTSALYLFFFSRVTDLPQGDIAKRKEFGIDRTTVNRRINSIVLDNDENNLARNQYLKTKIQDFVDSI